MDKIFEVDNGFSIPISLTLKKKTLIASEIYENTGLLEVIAFMVLEYCEDARPRDMKLILFSPGTIGITISSNKTCIVGIGSVAAKSGVESHWKILEINGKKDPVSNFQKYLKEVENSGEKTYILFNTYPPPHILQLEKEREELEEEIKRAITQRDFITAGITMKKLEINKTELEEANQIHFEQKKPPEDPYQTILKLEQTYYLLKGDVEDAVKKRSFIKTNHLLPKLRETEKKLNESKKAYLNDQKQNPDEKLITIQPGTLGVGINGNVITEVNKEGQAAKFGVCPRWTILEINGERQKNNTEEINAAFKKVKETRKQYTILFSKKKSLSGFPELLRLGEHLLTIQPGPIGIGINGNTITEVAPGSQAEKLGIRVRWKILEICGLRQCNNTEDINASFKKAKLTKKKYTILFSMFSDTEIQLTSLISRRSDLESSVIQLDREMKQTMRERDAILAKRDGMLEERNALG